MKSGLRPFFSWLDSQLNVLWLILVLIFIFETESPYATQTGLKLTAILLPQSSKCCNYVLSLGFSVFREES